MSPTLQTLALRRLRALCAARGAGLNARDTLVVLTELSKLGYRISNPDALEQVDPEWLREHGRLMAELCALRGGDVDYVPLFVGFPDDVPDGDEYLGKRLLGYLGDLLYLFPEDGDVAILDDGWVIPRWLFAVDRFGANPITQMQNEGQWRAARDRLAGRAEDEHVEWIDLELVFADELPARLQAYLRACLYARSPIKEELHKDLATLLLEVGEGAGIDCERIAINETKALMLRTFWDAGRLPAVVALAATPTDILRLCAALTDGDISLAAPVRFPKLTRAQRRAVLAVLEKSAALAEDLRRYRGLWLAFGRYLHPGEYRRRFARTAAAFDRLRNGRIDTFAAATERLIAAGDGPRLIEHLSARPGVFVRKLHELLRRCSAHTEAILSALPGIADAATVKSLLVLHKYFATINDDEHRTVINKRGKIKVLANNSHAWLDPGDVEAVRAVLRAALVRQLAARPSWAGKRVWIDPQLCDYTVPLQQRAASDGLLPFGRGSRVPVALDKVLRLFVYWKQTAMDTDLDLSVIQFDVDFRYLGHVSYTQLADAGIVHSGDLQSAPHGAAEFIDITLDQLPSAVRYLAVQVYRYAGESFAGMTCHAGWMVRERVDRRYQSFDVKTVANKFDLRGTGSYCLPLLVDLRARRIVLIDLYMGAGQVENSVEGACGQVAVACREVARFTELRPTIDELAGLHIEARGARRVERRADADIAFGVRGCDYNALDTEVLLAELL